MAGTDRADHNAGRLPILRVKVLIVDPVDAQSALLHHSFVGVELAGAVGAGPGAEFTADADRFVDQHDAVLGALVRGAGRAHGDAGRFLAMQTGFGEMNRPRPLAVPFLEGVDAVEPDAPGTIAIRV